MFISSLHLEHYNIKIGSQNFAYINIIVVRGKENKKSIYFPFMLLIK